MLTEANRFAWPGPDLRPGVNGEPSSIAYGSLPERLFERIRLGFLAKTKRRSFHEPSRGWRFKEQE